MSRWSPAGANCVSGPPPVGRLFADRHAVWRVASVERLPLSADDRDVWLAAGMPDLDGWRGHPYRLGVDWVAGRRPDWAPAAGDVPRGFATAPARRYRYVEWALYPVSDRWPMCSCCGEPMPCQAELQDREVRKGLTMVEKFATRHPDACWACGEIVTRRQRAVTYRGDNLDLPGAPAPRFHTRASCYGDAVRYEQRWLSADPRRERVLTWPVCGGVLVVHAGGASECMDGRTPFLGAERSTQPDCHGHLTHDHNVHVACFSRAWPGGQCPRGCRREEHRGTWTTARPERRVPA